VADPALIENSFYPKRSNERRSAPALLRRVFDTVECNSSYYAIPDPLMAAALATDPARLHLPRQGLLRS